MVVYPGTRAREHYYLISERRILLVYSQPHTGDTYICLGESYTCNPNANTRSAGPTDGEYGDVKAKVPWGGGGAVYEQ